MRAQPTSIAEPDANTDLGKPAVARGRPKSKRTPELEVTIGARVRAARISAGMNQTELGVAIGVSFQQVQKYEKGSDRIAASTLQTIAAAVGVHPGSFYDDVSLPIGNIFDVKAAMKAAEVIQQIRDPRILRHLLALAKTLAEKEPGAKNGVGAEHSSSINDEPG